ncbi:MAG: hypothetical protein HRU19_24590 [Pseudobacteriovorax sp.]|nr:hypothetical protein [Pseudobacteriovorax sp.]
MRPIILFLTMMTILVSHSDPSHAFGISDVIKDQIKKAAALAKRANTTACTSSDWIDAICDATEVSGSRCWSDDSTKSAMISGCVNAAVGCAEAGGCFGTVPVGHWVVTVINNVKYRCRCGCFAEETIFAGPDGEILGSDLIDLWRLNKENATAETAC